MAKTYGQSRYTPEQTRAIILQQLRAAAAANGLGEDWVRFSLSIPYQESNYVDNALNDGSATKTNEWSLGPWQINRKAHPNVSVEQAVDPVFATQHRIPSLISAWNALGGSAKAAADPVGFQGRYHAKAQVSWTPNAQQSRDALAQADAGIAGGAGALQTTEYRPERDGPNNVIQNQPGTLGEVHQIAPAIQVNRTPVQGGITSRFGTPFGMDSGASYQGRAYKNFNKGVDFGASGGSPVTAVVGGTVKLAADDGSGWGPRVVIVDPEGFEHSYGHLGQLAVKPGQQVQAGQQIAVVGSGKVGTSTGEHLSYDIFKNGEPVDPSPWLGQNVVDPAIQHDPQKAQVPAYLSGASSTTAGAAKAPATTAGTGFAAQQLQKAEEGVHYWERWKSETQAKPPDQVSEFDKQRLAFLENPDHPEGHLARARDAYAAAQVMAQREADLNPQAAGTNAAQNAQAITNWLGMLDSSQQTAFTNALGSFNAFAGLIGDALSGQVNISSLLKGMYDSNNAALNNWVQNGIAAKSLGVSAAAQVVTAASLQQAAEIARAAQGLARFEAVDAALFRNAERMLPPGTHYVPGLEPTGPLAQAMQKINLNFPGVRVTPTDWDKLDPWKNLAAAEATLAPVPDFGVAGVEAAAASAQNVPNPLPERVTAEGIGIPAVQSGVNDLRTAAGMVPQAPPPITAGQGGIPATADMIDMILGRGAYAPAPAQTTAPGTAGGAPTPVTAAPAQPGSPRPITNPTDTFTQHQPNQIPGTTEIRNPTAQASAAATDPARVNPAPIKLLSVTQPGEQAPAPGDPEAIRRWLEEWGYAGSPTGTPEGSVVATVDERLKRWVR